MCTVKYTYFVKFVLVQQTNLKEHCVPLPDSSSYLIYFTLSSLLNGR